MPKSVQDIVTGRFAALIERDLGLTMAEAADWANTGRWYAQTADGDTALTIAYNFQPGNIHLEYTGPALDGAPDSVVAEANRRQPHRVRGNPHGRGGRLLAYIYLQNSDGQGVRDVLALARALLTPYQQQGDTAS